MRTTLTLDEDVYARLQSEARRTGKPLKETVNEVIRLGLEANKPSKLIRPFKVKARDLGLRPGFSYDNVGDLLEQIEGPAHK